MLSFHFEDGSPTPGLDLLIEAQRAHGGRLILYRRIWAALLVTAGQNRIEWVPPGQSRHLAGWRHSLFTCVAGIWSFTSLIAVPVILFSNFRGGIDVTEFYSNAFTDPLRSPAPVIGTAEREAKNAQWALLGFLSLALAVLLIVLLT